MEISIEALIAAINAADKSKIETHIEMTDAIEFGEADRELGAKDVEQGFITKSLMLDNGVVVTICSLYDHPLHKASQVRIWDNEEDLVSIEGAIVVDEDGDEITEREIRREINATELAITESDWDREDEVEEVEGSEKIVVRDNEPDIKFVGVRIGSASTSPDSGHPDFSGSAGRWRVLRLFRTPSGKFICSRSDMTQWQGERDRDSGAVCETEAEVIKFFGLGALAKELYTDAGIDCSVRVG